MSTANLIKKEEYPKGIINSSEFEQQLSTLYMNEFNEILERILVKTEGDFMRALAQRVKLVLSENYPEDIYESISLTTAMRKVETEVYLTVYKKLYPVIKQLHAEPCDQSQPPPFFSKHCGYQSNHLLHHCPNDTTSASLAYSEDYLLCKKCSYVYRTSCAKLYCDFCSVEYYAKVSSCTSTSNSSSSNQVSSINGYQPATWEKYHCNILFNAQMKCISCKEKLLLDIPNDRLLCLQCGFTSNPYDILWKCIVCSAEFKSNAKVYNPLEYKMIKSTIKNALIKKDYAKPELFPCGHEKEVEKMRHKAECEGTLYIGYYNETKMVICCKCNVVTLHERYIWQCPICNKRFRDRTNEKGQVVSSPNEDNDVNSLNSSTNDSGNAIEKKRSSSITNEDSPLSSIESKRKGSSINHCFTKVASSSMPKLVLAENIPKIDLNDLTVISEITARSSMKVFAVRASSDKFYALKKLPHSKEMVNTCFVQYSIKCTGIIAIKGIDINDDLNELSILEELGICDLEKEIISRRRIKKYYTEMELLNLSYQLALSLSYLQVNGYTHGNIRTENVIVFKDGKYKLSGFSSLRQRSQGELDNSFNAKEDAFALGVLMLYTSAFIEQTIEDLLSIKQNTRGDAFKANEMIKELIKECLVKPGRYSAEYIDLLLGMLNADVNERFDFFAVNNYITTRFSSN